jgi:hypothetical protein
MSNSALVVEIHEQNNRLFYNSNSKRVRGNYQIGDPKDGRNRALQKLPVFDPTSVVGLGRSPPPCPSTGFALQRNVLLDPPAAVVLRRRPAPAARPSENAIALVARLRVRVALWRGMEEEGLRKGGFMGSRKLLF